MHFCNCSDETSTDDHYIHGIHGSVPTFGYTVVSSSTFYNDRTVFFTFFLGKRFSEDFPPSSSDASLIVNPKSSSSSSSPTPKSLVEGVKVLLGEFAVTLRDSASFEETLRHKDAKITELQQTLGRREHEVDDVKKHLVSAEAEVNTKRSFV